MIPKTIGGYAVTLTRDPVKKYWVAEIPDIPTCSSDGPTRVDAFANLERAFALLRREYRSSGLELPVPRAAGGTPIRPEFVAAMREQLEAHAYKGDWIAFRFRDRRHATDLLSEHFVKLVQDLRSGAMGPASSVRQHAADVANIAMKIDECFGPPA
jgi:predicted RNase H-like HicB family nuclease